MAQINPRTHPQIAPVLTGVHTAHRQIINQLKAHEQALARLKTAQDAIA